jgi:hypothetical protein
MAIEADETNSLGIVLQPIAAMLPIDWANALFYLGDLPPRRRGANHRQSGTFGAIAMTPPRQLPQRRRFGEARIADDPPVDRQISCLGMQSADRGS